MGIHFQSRCEHSSFTIVKLIRFPGSVDDVAFARKPRLIPALSAEYARTVGACNYCNFGLFLLLIPHRPLGICFVQTLLMDLDEKIVEQIVLKVSDRIQRSIASFTRQLAEIRNDLVSSKTAWTTAFGMLTQEMKTINSKSSKYLDDRRKENSKVDSIRDTMSAKFDEQERKMTASLEAWQAEIHGDLRMWEARIQKCSDKGRDWVENAVQTIKEDLNGTSLEVSELQENILQQTSVIDKYVRMIAGQQKSVDEQSKKIHEIHTEIHEMRDAEWSKMQREVETLKSNMIKLSNRISDKKFLQLKEHFPQCDDSLEHLQGALESANNISPMRRSVLESQLKAMSRDGSAESRQLGTEWFRTELGLTDTSSSSPRRHMTQRGRSTERSSRHSCFYA